MGTSMKNPTHPEQNRQGHKLKSVSHSTKSAPSLDHLLEKKTIRIKRASLSQQTDRAKSACFLQKQDTKIEKESKLDQTPVFQEPFQENYFECVYVSNIEHNNEDKFQSKNAKTQLYENYYFLTPQRSKADANDEDKMMIQEQSKRPNFSKQKDLLLNFQVKPVSQELHFTFSNTDKSVKDTSKTKNLLESVQKKDKMNSLLKKMKSKHKRQCLMLEKHLPKTHESQNKLTQKKGLLRSPLGKTIYAPQFSSIEYHSSIEKNASNLERYYPQLTHKEKQRKKTLSKTQSISKQSYSSRAILDQYNVKSLSHHLKLQQKETLKRPNSNLLSVKSLTSSRTARNQSKINDKKNILYF